VTDDFHAGRLRKNAGGRKKEEEWTYVVIETWKNFHLSEN
jgi:hypothetical protein